MKILKSTYLFFTYNLSLIGFFAISLVFNFFCFLIGLSPLRNSASSKVQKTIQNFYSAWASFMSALGVLHLKRPERTPTKNAKGCIWLANHPCILDNSYLLTFITAGNSIYKQSISTNPFYGSTAKLAGYIPNSGGPDMIRDAVDSLKNGRDLVIFPEGTRSTQFNKELVKPGFALIAKRAEVEIKLLWIDNPDDFLTREAPLFGLPKLPAQIEITQFDEISANKRSSISELTTKVSNSFENRSHLAQKSRHGN